MRARSKLPRPRANPKTTIRIVTLGSERGFSATKYDGNPVGPPKSLRRQFREKYDEN
jgi:hypothetical protein